MGSPLPPISISDAVSGCETACCVSKLTIISSERATQNLAAVIDMHAAALRSERVRTGSVLHFELPFTFNTSASNHLIFHLVFMYVQRFFS